LVDVGRIQRPKNFRIRRIRPLHTVSNLVSNLDKCTSTGAGSVVAYQLMYISRSCILLQNRYPDCPDLPYSEHKTLALSSFCRAVAVRHISISGTVQYNVFFHYPGWRGCKLFAAVIILTVNVIPLPVLAFCCAVINFLSVNMILLPVMTNIRPSLSLGSSLLF
jgi:hypothetical protein